MTKNLNVMGFFCCQIESELNYTCILLLLYGYVAVFLEGLLFHPLLTLNVTAVCLFVVAADSSLFHLLD